MREQRCKVTAAERAVAAQGRPATVVDVAVERDMTEWMVEEAADTFERIETL
ncbi:hypothetical protein AB0M00_10445 [Streptomyces chartreusis]|uniref:hypothetical protein n=1 Tax=Streptomyces chartreusis TaxID=1969 RepID=UPI0034477DBC